MDNRPPKDRSLFHKNMYEVIRYRTLYDTRTPDEMHAERVERRLAKMQAEKDRAEYERKQAELNKDKDPTLGQLLLTFAVYFFAFLGFVLIISAIVEGEEERKSHTAYPSHYNYTTVGTTTTYRTTTQKTTTTQTSTRRKSTTRKKTSTKKDKYNVYDYADPEDFYEDNYDDFWDYEDAEDYYREKWKQK